MKIAAIFLITLAFSSGTYAQTEKIAHLSHSGKNSTFRYTGYNNWGETPAMRAERLKRDSAMRAMADSIAKKARIDSLASKPATGKTKKTTNRRKQKAKTSKNPK